MKIGISFEGLERVMSKVSDLVGDTMSDESLRSLIIATENDDLRFAAYNGNVTSVTKVPDATMDLTGDFVHPFVMVRAKDVTDVLSTFRSLKRTKVERIEFEFNKSGQFMIVHEVALAEDMPDAEKYNKLARFKVRLMDARPGVIKEVQAVDLTRKGVELEAKDFLGYINALLPTVAKEKRLTTNSITFGEESIYTFLATYLAVMDNKLPQELNGFRLTNTMAGFIKSFIGSDETFGFHKEVGRGQVLLTLFTSDSVAVIKTADLTQANRIDQYTGLPDTGIVVDKAYLLDVLKRLALAGSAEKIVVSVTVEGGDGKLEVKGKSMKQEVPLVGVKGSGSFKFDIQGDTLASVVFSHTNMFDENVFIYLEITPDGRSTSMCCTDNTGAWVTRMPRLSNVQDGFDW